MYSRITAENPYEQPMMIYPAPHYAMGGLWVDYELQTTVNGLFAIGEANFSDHGANRLGASAMMQCLADGYFIVPHTVANHIARQSSRVDESHPAFDSTLDDVRERVSRLMNVNGTTAPQVLHRELGHVMLDKCGMSRTAEGLTEAIEKIHELRDHFWNDVRVDGRADQLNQSLELAGRVADFIELGEVMCLDALRREESAGGHFREEHQTGDGEALRDDENHATVTAWEYGGEGGMPVAHEEQLSFDNVKLATRSYK